MAEVQSHRIVDPASSQQPSKLLQLDRAVLDLVMQRLDIQHLANLAASCSKLSVTIPSVLTQVTLYVRESDAEALASLSMWLDRHSSSNRLANLTDCRIYCHSSPNWFPQKLDRLPCTHLRHLKLRGLDVQLEPAPGQPGVLQDCRGLTALDLERCTMSDFVTAFAAIAALPELQHLRLDGCSDDQEEFFFGELQYPLQLTFLEVHPCGSEPFTAECLSQLSALVNLQHLDLEAVASELPGGLPSQLAKLTCLRVHYDCEFNVAEQFQHLSTVTALQRLGIGCERANAAVDVPDIRQLSKLTSLELASSALDFSTSSTTGLTSLTSLQRLDLERCKVQPSALEALAQLRALRLSRLNTHPEGDGFLEDTAYSTSNVLYAVSELTLLTELCYVEEKYDDMRYPPMATPPSASAFTALTASTDLCMLDLLVFDRDSTHAWAVPWKLFSPGPIYPHLRSINLHCSSTGMPVSEQQLQQMCSCCPVVESLDLRLSANASSTACLSLLQLSALTRLRAGVWRDVTQFPAWEPAAAVAAAAQAAEQRAAVAAAGLVDVAAQLTGLKQLVLAGPWLADRIAVLQLTALTGLKMLELIPGEFLYHRMCFWSKARWCSPPDVWIQLLRHLLRDAACRQALLRRSSAAAAAHAQLMLAQLAATLAEELAGSIPIHI